MIILLFHSSVVKKVNATQTSSGTYLPIPHIKNYATQAAQSIHSSSTHCIHQQPTKFQFLFLRMYLFSNNIYLVLKAEFRDNNGSSMIMFDLSHRQ